MLFGAYILSSLSLLRTNNIKRNFTEKLQTEIKILSNTGLT